MVLFWHIRVSQNGSIFFCPAFLTKGIVVRDVWGCLFVCFCSSQPVCLMLFVGAVSHSSLDGPGVVMHLAFGLLHKFIQPKRRRNLYYWMCRSHL